MKLPNKPYPLLAFAAQSEVKENDIKAAIDNGVMDYFLNSWLAYSVSEMRDQNYLNGLSAVGAFHRSHEILGEITEDFKNQVNEREIANAKANGENVDKEQ